MKVFIAGTDTGIGKTLISSWLCLHTKYDYFKPIQTGSLYDLDSQTVAFLSQAKIYPESYLFSEPLSPHLAAAQEDRHIELEKISLPSSHNLIIEGAGGLLVPINEKAFIIDIITYFSLPVFLVSSSRLGTINHTLLSIEILRQRGISLLGVIMVGKKNPDNRQAIEYYGKTEVLMEMPPLTCVNQESLKEIPLSHVLKRLLTTE